MRTERPHWNKKGAIFRIKSWRRCEFSFHVPKSVHLSIRGNQESYLNFFLPKKIGLIFTHSSFPMFIALLNKSNRTFSDWLYSVNDDVNTSITQLFLLAILIKLHASEKAKMIWLIAKKFSDLFLGIVPIKFIFRLHLRTDILQFNHFKTYH